MIQGPTNILKSHQSLTILGPYIKSRGTKMSANADLITVETYVQQEETI